MNDTERGLRERVEATLRDVRDARSERNVFEAGLVEGVRVEESRAIVEADLDRFDPRTRSEVVDAVLAATEDVPGVEQVHVEPAQPTAGDRVTLAEVDTVIAVASTKGGVGKSTVATHLACALAADRDVGLFDADIFGPNVPSLLEVGGPVRTDDEERPVPVRAGDLEVMSVDFMTDEGALAWRGAMAHEALSDLFADTAWDRPDVVVIDLPPGTSDVVLTTLQEVPIDGAVFVTTPFHTSVADTRRSVRLFEENGVPVLGAVVNMDGFVCEECGHDHDTFPGGDPADELGISTLARLPFDTDIQERATPGEPPASFAALAGAVTERVEGVERLDLPEDAVDLRGVDAQRRVDRVREAFESLDAGETLYLRSDRDPTPVGGFLLDLLDREGDPADVLPEFEVERRGPDEWALAARRP
jgi:ATP-binding protein involved in chromosome partitioning